MSPASTPRARPDPGSAKVSEIAAHWAVSPATARAILRAAGLPDVGLGGWSRHRWRDIWALEGDPYVAPADWPDWRAQLLIPSHLHERDPRFSPRSWRRHVAAGRVRSITLSGGIIRVRPVAFDAAAGFL